MKHAKEIRGLRPPNVHLDEKTALVLRRYRSESLGGTLVLLVGWSALAVIGQTASPLEERSSFHLADPALTIELVAAEPDVVSPVAVAWDANARLFVAEMRDYPNAAGGGQIRLLEDRDGDGHYERVTVFADKFPFPNSVLPWNGGVLVTAAPDLWFLKDLDGDGRADERRRLFTGFNPGNQQLRVNGLIWGLDNWVYGANGRSDGEVRPADDESGAGGRWPVSLRGHDFRFRPASGEFEAVAGRSQFGLGRDDWGHRFLSWNTIPVRHEVLTERALTRNPHLVATDSLQDLLEPGDDGAVFPLTAPPLTFNQESTSHFNALAGLCVFRGDALGTNYLGNVFVGESLRNLVHRRVLEPRGPTFVARRAEHGREFLASTDPWFHPVFFADGPDGALYVVDFYRRFVEHPDFVHGPARNEMPWQSGAEHGRLWRIYRRGDRPPSPSLPRLESLSARELVRRLEHSNGWMRDTAQRLLFERQERGARTALERLAKNAKSPQARVQALHTLDGLQELSAEILRRALDDPHPRVRESAVRLSGRKSAVSFSAALRERLSVLSGDTDSRVRLELALAIGEQSQWDSRTRVTSLATLACRDATNRWHGLAILSSAGLTLSPFALMQEMVRREPRWLAAPTVSEASFFEQLGRLLAAADDEEQLEGVVNLLLRSSPQRERGRLSVLAGLTEGMASTPRPLRQRLSPSEHNGVSSQQGLATLMAMTIKVAENANVDASERSIAVRVLPRAGTGPAGAVLERLVLPEQPVELQAAAARGLAELGDAEVYQRVLSRWTQLTRTTRRELALAAVRTKAATVALLLTLEAGTIRPIELDLPARQALLRHAEQSLRQRATSVLQMGPSERGEVIRRYQAALQLTGERARGAGWFGRNCLVCHALGGQGQAVGPDLAGLGSRPKEAVLEDILEPSRQIAPDFVSYSLLTKAGETLTGLLAAESATGVTLRRAGQPDETLLRSQVQEWRVETKSLMPDGLEQGMSEQDMADLLEFLRQPDARLLSTAKSP